ncbi:MAG: hypothetical protein M3126_10090 [Candidatus Eremiobacteraeota bacterium]|nr:hypothetical protein [Candidatus Eremiobacteraeota bacterium]
MDIKKSAIAVALAATLGVPLGFAAVHSAQAATVKTASSSEQRTAESADREANGGPEIADREANGGPEIADSKGNEPAGPDRDNLQQGPGSTKDGDSETNDGNQETKE